MEELLERIEQLEAQVDELGLQVEGHPVAVAFPLPRWNWESLSDEEARAERTDLGDWVSWLAETYALLDRWPVCWHEHSDVVMWVIALRTWHRAVYAPELESASDEDEPQPTADADRAQAAPRAYWEWHTSGLRPFLTEILPSLTKQCAAMHVELSAEMLRHHDDHRASMQDGACRFVQEHGAGATRTRSGSSHTRHAPSSAPGLTEMRSSGAGSGP